MIDEVGLCWERFASGHGPAGSDFVEYRCAEHPRLSYLVQHQVGGAPAVHTYQVDGLKNVFHTPAEALEAERANP